MPKKRRSNRIRLLRAFMVKRKREFESRHDLLLLFKESGILDMDPDTLYQRTKGDLLKAKAYDLLKSAQQFVDKGVLQWQ